MRYTTRIIVPPRVRRSGMPGATGAGPRPQAIGVRKSLGFGDRLGLAGNAHLAIAAEHPDFAPFFAQQSVRDLAETARSLPEVMAAASRAVGQARFRPPWGADADLLRSPQEVDEAAAAGFTYFTIDLSEHIRADADQLAPDALASTVDAMIADGELPEDWFSPYLDRAVELPGGVRLRLDIDALRRAAVKFGRAILHGARMYETVTRANRGRPSEVEISFDQIATPIGAVEHLYAGLELEARGVRLTSLGLRLNDQDAAACETTLREHAAVASFCGPYKLSFRGEAHRPSIIPLIGRSCGDALHYKTSVETSVEALRLAWRLEPAIFRRILETGELPAKTADEEIEAEYFDGVNAADRTNRLLGAVFAAPDVSLKTALLELIEQRADIYQELLVARYARLIQALKVG